MNPKPNRYLHTLYPPFLRSGGRRCPRFSVGFFTRGFGLAFDAAFAFAFAAGFAFALAFGRAAGGPADRACFPELRGTDPSVEAASNAGRFSPCLGTTVAGCAPDVLGTSSWAGEDRDRCRARSPGKSRRAAALVLRHIPCKKVCVCPRGLYRARKRPGVTSWIPPVFWARFRCV